MTETIDIHSHIVPDHFPAGPARCCEHWPGMTLTDADHGMATLGGRDFRKLDARSWRASARIADMDREGVAMQALSPMPDLLSYWMEAEDTLELGRHLNGFTAAMVAAAPTRFSGLAMVPMQDPELAARQIAGLKADGFRGIEVGSNVCGRSPGDPMFDPVYEQCAAHGMCVFVHALRPTTNDRLVGPKPPLAAFIGFPTEMGLAAASFVTGGTLTRFPGLKIGFSHGAGTFASLLPRLQNGWRVAPELQQLASPEAVARTMFYDNIVMHQPTLAHLIALFGDTQLMAGSDYPYLAGQSFPGRPFEELGLAEDVLHWLRTNNAKRFLGL